MIKKYLLRTSTYFICTTLFIELMIFINSTSEKLFSNFINTFLLTSFVVTILAGLLSLIPKPKIYRSITVIVILVFSFIGGTEICIDNAFGFYSSITDMIQNGGNVATGFTANLTGVIKGNLHNLFLLFCPTIIYIYLLKNKYINDSRKNRMPCFILMGTGILLFCLSMISVSVTSKRSFYTTDFTFDTAVRNFGLTSALRLDPIRSKTPETLQPVELSSEDFFLPTPTPTPLPTVAETSANSELEETIETTPSPTPTPIQYHDCGIDFTELSENETNSTYKSMDEYIASQTPATFNEYTGIFEGYNLILITAEAFSREAIIPELMPTLYEMYTEGIYFEDYYQPAWGGSTSTGEFSNIIGLMPTDAVNSMMRTRYDNMYYTLGNQLQRLNYFSAAYHANDYKYYNRHQTHTNLGYDTWTGYWNGLEAGITLQWPESDLEMIDYTVPMYINQEPFSIYYMSVSGHCSYHKGSNAMSAKNFSYVEDMECSNTIKCYYAANLELEFAMESLVKQLDEAGVLDHTLIVIGPDHYPYGLDNSSAWGNSQDYLQELYGYKASTCFERDHSVLIIWTPKLEDMNITVSDPAFSLDIVPTVSNLLGLDYDSRMLVGRDVLSNDTPIIFWPDRSWKTNIGTYRSSNSSFTFAEGIELDDEQKSAYIDTINSIVRARISFSGNVVYNDYYGHIFGPDEDNG